MQVFVELIGPRGTTGPLQLPKVRRSFRAGRAAGGSFVQRVANVMRELLLRHLMPHGSMEGNCSLSIKRIREQAHAAGSPLLSGSAAIALHSLMAHHHVTCALHLVMTTDQRATALVAALQASRCRVSRMWAPSGSCVSAPTAPACCPHGTSSEQFNLGSHHAALMQCPHGTSSEQCSSG